MSEPEGTVDRVVEWLENFTLTVENVMPAPLRVGAAWHVFCFRRKDGKEVEKAFVYWHGREDRHGNLSGGTYQLEIPGVTDQTDNPDYYKLRTRKRTAPSTLSGEALKWLDHHLSAHGITRMD